MFISWKKREENGTFHLTIEADDTLHDIADDSRDIFFNGFLEKKRQIYSSLQLYLLYLKLQYKKVYVFYNV